MDSFFKETAEELVNRLINDWVQKNTFPDCVFFTYPSFKDYLIAHLNIFDRQLRKEWEKRPHLAIENEPDDWSEAEKMLDNRFWKEFFQNHREHLVLIRFTQLINEFYNKRVNVLPPKPTHRQHKSKTPYLRLVVNG
jgi:hypothetical protein